MSTIFYVYEIWNPLKNSPFYVGKSNFNRSKNTRKNGHLSEARLALNKKRKRNHKINTILKILKEGYNIDFRIVFETGDEIIAKNKEIELIAKYGRLDNGTGILTNMTDGGEGTVGYIFPQWLRDLRRKLSRGENNGMFGKTHSPEARKIISEKLREGFKNGSIRPTKHTEEHKQKLCDDNKGGKATARPIHQICPITGEIIHTYDSSQSAAKIFNGSKSNINSCTKKHKNRICYGFYWRLADDSSESYPLDVYSLNERRDNRYRASKKVIQLDKNKQFVKEWESASAVCRYLNKNVGNLNFYITRNKMYCNYYWKFA